MHLRWQVVLYGLWRRCVLVSRAVVGDSLAPLTIAYGSGRPSATELFRSPLLVSLTNYRATSRLHRPTEFSAVVWRLIFSVVHFRLSVVPVKWLVSIGHCNRFCYLRILVTTPPLRHEILHDCQSSATHLNTTSPFAEEKGSYFSVGKD